jgi:hypothetical protein
MRPFVIPELGIILRQLWQAWLFDRERGSHRRIYCTCRAGMSADAPPPIKQRTDLRRDSTYLIDPDLRQGLP